MRNKSYFADHSSEVVMKSAASWPRAIMQVWMKRLPSTGRANRLAAGLEGYSSSLGPPLPITMASRVTRRMSQYRNCWSATLVFTWTHTKNDYLGEKKKNKTNLCDLGLCFVFMQIKSTGLWFCLAFGVKRLHRSHFMGYQSVQYWVKEHFPHFKVGAPHTHSHFHLLLRITVKTAFFDESWTECSVLSFMPFY